MPLPAVIEQVDDGLAVRLKSLVLLLWLLRLLLGAEERLREIELKRGARGTVRRKLRPGVSRNRPSACRIESLSALTVLCATLPTSMLRRRSSFPFVSLAWLSMIALEFSTRFLSLPTNAAALSAADPSEDSLLSSGAARSSAAGSMLTPGIVLLIDELP